MTMATLAAPETRTWLAEQRCLLLSLQQQTASDLLAGPAPVGPLSNSTAIRTPAVLVTESDLIWEDGLEQLSAILQRLQALSSSENFSHCPVTKAYIQLDSIEKIEWWAAFSGRDICSFELNKMPEIAVSDILIALGMSVDTARRARRHLLPEDLPHLLAALLPAFRTLLMSYLSSVFSRPGLSLNNSGEFLGHPDWLSVDLSAPQDRDALARFSHLPFIYAQPRGQDAVSLFLWGPPWRVYHNPFLDAPLDSRTYSWKEAKYTRVRQQLHSLYELFPSLEWPQSNGTWKRSILRICLSIVTRTSSRCFDGMPMHPDFPQISPLAA